MDIVAGARDRVFAGDALEECDQLLVVGVGALFADDESGFVLADARSCEEIDACERALGVHRAVREPVGQLFGVGVVLFADGRTGGGETPAEEDAVLPEPERTRATIERSTRRRST